MRPFRALAARVTAAVVCALAAAPGLAQEWSARHGMTPGQYQAAVNDMASKGFRLRSVSGYESNGPRFAALWVKGPGPALAARHGMSPAGYQQAFNEMAGQGYRILLVNGYTHGGQARYAAIWEKKTGPAQAARHGMTSAQYQAEVTARSGQGYRLTHLCGYTVGGSPRFAAIWEKSGGPAQAARHGMTASQYQQAFNDMSRQGFRPTIISGYRAGGTDYYAALWEKVSGPYWSARHGVPDSWYQNVFDNYVHQAYRPAHISAFTSGSRGRLNCVWENTAFKGADLELIASRVNSYRSQYGAPAVAIAIARNGRLLYASGFGEADKESGEEAGARSLFRIASVSKPITSVAIMRLVETNRLNLDDRVFGQNSILGSRYPTPSNNKRIEGITVRHLLQHVSGLSNTPNDPMFQNLSLNHDELIKWVLSDSDRATATRLPGTLYEYLNFGYCLLGRVIEARSGRSYEDFVRQDVLARCGISDMRVAFNKKSQQRPREVTYYPSGAYNLNVRRFDAHGGWIASPVDLLRLMVRVDGDPGKPDIVSAASRTAMLTKAGIRDKDNNDPNYGLGWACSPQSHNGAMRGTLAVMGTTGSGFTYAAVVNTRPSSDGFAGNLTSMLTKVISDVSSWPAHDLF